VAVTRTWRANTQRYTQYIDACSAANGNAKKALPNPPAGKKRGKKAEKAEAK
jgi:hypothetical protein